MLGLSIVIPVYKEKKNLIILVKRIYKKIKIDNFEIIIIDDDSNDGSFDVLKKLKSKFKKLKFFIRKKKPRDLSRSCIMGFQKSKFDKILVMDGDLQHRPEEINKLYNKIIYGNYDMVVGNRGLLEKRNKGLKLYRFISSVILVLIVNLFLGFKTKDPMSGFFIFRKKIYYKNKSRLFNKGYKILLDLIYSSKENIKVADVFINFNVRKEGFSKMDLNIIYLVIVIILKKFINRITN